MQVSKYTENFLIDGTAEYIEWFYISIRKRFKFVKTITEGKMNFNGSLVMQDTNGDLLISM